MERRRSLPMVSWSKHLQYFALLGVALSFLSGCGKSNGKLPEIEFRHGVPKRADAIGYVPAFGGAGGGESFAWDENKDPQEKVIKTVALREEAATAAHPDFVIVQEGETLFSISQKYQVTGGDIITFNKLKPPYTVNAGQKLWLREPLSEEASAPTSLKPQVKKSAYHRPVSARLTLSPDQKKATAVITRTASVSASQPGEVIYTGKQVKELGMTVLVQHPDNVVTVYGGLSEILVSQGQKVQAGDLLGKVMPESGATQALFHFEIRKGLKPVPMAGLVSLDG